MCEKIERGRHIDTNRHTVIQSVRERHTDIQRQTDSKCKEAERQTDTEREREREREIKGMRGRLQ